MFVAEAGTKNQPEHRGRNTARDEDFAERHFFQFPHQVSRKRKTQPLPEIAKHDAEQQDISAVSYTHLDFSVRAGRIPVLYLRGRLHPGGGYADASFLSG